MPGLARPLAVLGVVTFAVLIALIAAGSGRPTTPAVQASPVSSTPGVASPTSAPPATGPSPTAAPGVRDPAALLAAHNALRTAIGAPPVRADARVTAAAQKHAEYLAVNGAGGHEERSGDPGFTGVSVRDRLLAQGYADATASEVATSVAGTDAVRSLWDLPYHRLGLMHPHAVVAGWGVAESGGRVMTVGVLVYDFASPAPDAVRSPGSGQTQVPLQWDGNEDVDVAPGAARPLGYTVMAVYSRARTVTLRGSSLTAGGRAIEHAVAPQIYERDYVAIVPLAPLLPATRYRVRLELTIAGVDMVDDWEFETGR